MYGAGAGQAVVRQQLPAGPPPGRARRALRPALRLGLGHPRHGNGDDIVHSASRKMPGDRPAGRRPVTDLKQRGLLDDTLVIWGGEFGRTPMHEDAAAARKFLGPRPSSARASPSGWPAAASSRASRTARPTNSATTSPTIPVHVHDFHATILTSSARSRAAHLPLPGPRFPPDRRWRSVAETPGVSRSSERTLE